MGSYKDLITSYAHSVISGEVIACEKHIWACKRFLSDIEREKSDKDFPYYFDEKRAEGFSKWASLFKHRKGTLAGKYIDLDPIQHFIFGNIYGWYHNKTNFRRFKKLYWQVARKNAKSQSLSLVCSYELFIFCGKEVVEIYAAATKTDQAKIVYDETVAMVRQCKDILDEIPYKVAYGRLTKLSDESFMRAMSKDDKKSGDGMNPQCATVDEYHAHQTSEIYDVIDSGMGARPQPLLAIITTAGPELNNPCYRVEYSLVSDILNPASPVSIESYFIMINELDRNNSSEDIIIEDKVVKPGELIDDINDERVWLKASPIQCSYEVGRDYVRDKLKIAKAAPEKMKDFLTKNMNVWVNARAFGFMNMSKWNAAARKNIIELIKENTNSNAFLGLDLSKKIDLTSACLEFEGGGRYYALSHSFMPRENFESKMATDNVPYDLWEKQGWLTVTEGSVVDFRAVKKWALDMALEHRFNIEEACIDSWGATMITPDLADEGIVVVDIIQGFKTLSEPTKHLRESVYSGNFFHDGSPVLEFAMGNAVIRSNYNENIALDKDKSKQRIDPAAALVNSHVRAITGEPEDSGRVFFV